MKNSVKTAEKQHKIARKSDKKSVSKEDFHELNLQLDDLKSGSNVNREMNTILDCLLNSAEKKCKECRKVHTCSILMEAVIAYRNQINKHDPHG